MRLVGIAMKSPTTQSGRQPFSGGLPMPTTFLMLPPQSELTREWARRLAETELRLRLTDARSRVLGGRVDLYSLNFGSASQNFEAARQIVTGTSEMLAAADAKDPRLDRLRAALGDLAGLSPSLSGLRSFLRQLSFVTSLSPVHSR
jgi:hypothetical protein